MPVFDFKADWKDMFGRAANSSDSSPDTPSVADVIAKLASAFKRVAGPAPDPPAWVAELAQNDTGADAAAQVKAPVVSYYLWPYLGVSVGLTLLTLDMWYMTTGYPKRWTWRRSRCAKVVMVMLKAISFVVINILWKPCLALLLCWTRIPLWLVRIFNQLYNARHTTRTSLGGPRARRKGRSSNGSDPGTDDRPSPIEMA